MLCLRVLLTLLCLFARVSNYGSNVPAGVLDVTCQSTFAETASFLTNVSISWEPHLKIKVPSSVTTQSLISIARSRAHDVGLALSSTSADVAGRVYNVVVDLACATDLYCGSSNIPSASSSKPGPSKSVLRPTSHLSPTSHSPSPTQARLSYHSKVKNRSGSVPRDGLIYFRAFRSLHLNARSWRLLGWWGGSDNNKRAQIPRSGPPLNACTLPDLSHCGVGALYLEPIELVIEWRPSYSPWVEVTIGALTLTVLLAAGLAYSGVLSALWWILCSFIYVLVAIVRALVWLLKKLGYIFNCLFVAFKAILRWLLCLCGQVIKYVWRTGPPLNGDCAERFYDEIVAGAALTSSAWVSDLVISTKQTVATSEINKYHERPTKIIRIGPATSVSIKLQEGPSSAAHSAPVVSAHAEPNPVSDTSEPTYTTPIYITADIGTDQKLAQPFSDVPDQQTALADEGNEMHDVTCAVPVFPSVTLGKAEVGVRGAYLCTDASTVAPDASSSTNLGSISAKTSLIRSAVKRNSKSRIWMRALKVLKDDAYQGDDELDGGGEEQGVRHHSVSFVQPVFPTSAEPRLLNNRSDVSCTDLEAELSGNEEIAIFAAKATKENDENVGKNSETEAAPEDRKSAGHRSAVEISEAHKSTELKSTIATIYAPCSTTTEVASNERANDEWDSSADTIVSIAGSSTRDKLEDQGTGSQAQDTTNDVEHPESMRKAVDSTTPMVNTSYDHDEDFDGDSSESSGFMEDMREMIESAVPVVEPAYIQSDPDQTADVASPTPAVPIPTVPLAAPALYITSHEALTSVVPSIRIVPPTPPTPTPTPPAPSIPPALLALINSPTPPVPPSTSPASTPANVALSVPPKPVLTRSQRDRMLDALEQEEEEEEEEDAGRSRLLRGRWHGRF